MHRSNNPIRSPRRRLPTSPPGSLAPAT